jgi:uncharacterized membrane protein YqjE
VIAGLVIGKFMVCSAVRFGAGVGITVSLLIGDLAYAETPRNDRVTTAVLPAPAGTFPFRVRQRERNRTTRDSGSGTADGGWNRAESGSDDTVAGSPPGRLGDRLSPAQLDNETTTQRHTARGPVRRSRRRAGRAALEDRPAAGEEIRMPEIQDIEEKSIGELVAQASSSVSSLVRSEMELAKLELKSDAKKAAMGATLFAIAGAIACLIVILLSFALAYGLVAVGVPEWASFIIVALLYLALAIALCVIGGLRMRRMSGMKRTIKTAKDDFAMLRRREGEPGDSEITEVLPPAGHTAIRERSDTVGTPADDVK